MESDAMNHSNETAVRHTMTGSSSSMHLQQQQQYNNTAAAAAVVEEIHGRYIYTCVQIHTYSYVVKLAAYDEVLYGIRTNKHLGNFDGKTKTACLPGRGREHGRGRPRQSRQRRAW